MYAATKDSLLPTPSINGSKTHSIDLQSTGKRMTLLSRSACVNLRVLRLTKPMKSSGSPLPLIPKHPTANDTFCARPERLALPQRVDSVPTPPRSAIGSTLALDADPNLQIAIDEAHHEKLVGPPPVVKHLPKIDLRQQRTLKRQQTRATIHLPCSSRKQSDRRRSKVDVLERGVGANGSREATYAIDEWDMLDRELRRPIFSNRSTPQSLVRRSRSIDHQSAQSIDRSRRNVSSRVARHIDANKQWPDSTREGGFEEGDPGHCWACKLEDSSRIRRGSTSGQYSVHVCGKKNPQEDLSLSATQSIADHSESDATPVAPLITLDQIILAAKGLSLQEDPPVRILAAENNRRGGKAAAQTERHYLTEIVVKEEKSTAVISDAEDDVQLSGVPPSTISSSDDEEKVVGKTFSPYNHSSRRPPLKLQRNATVDSADQPILSNHPPPVDLDENSDKELDHMITTRNSRRQFLLDLNQSSCDAGNLNLNLMHQTSWNSSFSLASSNPMAPKLSSFGANASFVGSLASDDGNEG